MSKEILKCSSCGTYTLKIICPNCKKKAVNPKPAKFSPEDKWGKYRRMQKRKSKNFISIKT